MKRAFGFIAATLLTTSIYSQDYSSSSSTQNPDSTPDYQSRQSEAGAPASSDSGLSSSTGYDRAPGLSGGNSSTGQSNGSNIGSAADQDQSLTTRDSDVSGGEYRGSVQSEPESSFNSEFSTDSSSSGSSGTSVSGSSSSDLSSGELKGSGTADGAFHDPASPVREGANSEGWSGSGTFSGAGPGSVSGSASSTDSSISSKPLDSSSSTFNSDVSGNTSLNNRDQDLSNRGLQPDSDQITRDDANRSDDDVMIFEDWTVIEPDTNVGAPAESESGSSSSSSSSSSDSYSNDLHDRVQRDWSSRLGTTDVPATNGVQPMSPSVMDHDFDHLRLYNGTTQSDVGAPGSSTSGSKSSDDDIECDHNKGSAAESERGDSNSSDSDYHINRGDDEKYHFNRSDDDSTSAPGEYGDRPSSDNYDDGHLNGNNAQGSSGSSESSSSTSEDGALTQPDL